MHANIMKTHIFHEVKYDPKTRESSHEAHLAKSIFAHLFFN